MWRPKACQMLKRFWHIIVNITHSPDFYHLSQMKELENWRTSSSNNSTFLHFPFCCPNTFLHLAEGTLLNHSLSQLHSIMWFIQPLFYRWAFRLFPKVRNYKNAIVSNSVDIRSYSVGVVPIILPEMILLSQKVYGYAVLLDIAKITSIEILPISISTRKMLVFFTSLPTESATCQRGEKKAS